MSKQNNLRDFLEDLSSTIKKRLNITTNINPQNFSSKIIAGELTKPIITVGYDNDTNTTNSFTFEINEDNDYLANEQHLFTGNVTIKTGFSPSSPIVSGVFSMIVSKTNDNYSGTLEIKYKDQYGTVYQITGSISSLQQNDYTIKYKLFITGVYGLTNFTVLNAYRIPMFELKV